MGLRRLRGRGAREPPREEPGDGEVLRGGEAIGKQKKDLHVLLILFRPKTLLV